MDFKNILTKFDDMKSKEKKVVKKESKKVRPLKMLTESDSVSDTSGRLSSIPSLKDVFNSLVEGAVTLEPVQSGAQTIKSDGEPVGVAHTPQAASQMKSAMEKGEITFEEEDMDEGIVSDLIGKGATAVASNPGVKDAAGRLATDAVGSAVKNSQGTIDSMASRAGKSAGDAAVSQVNKAIPGAVNTATDQAISNLKGPAIKTGAAIAGATGAAAYGGTKLANNQNKDDVNEKWSGDTEIKSTGKWADKTIAELQKTRSALKDKENRTSEETSKLRQINFAIRSKRDWKGDVEEGLTGAVAGGVLGGKAGGIPGALAGAYLGHKTQQAGNANEADGSGSYGGQSPLTYEDGDYDVKPTRNPQPAKGKVLNPKGKTDGQSSPETYVESKSRKLPNISRVKAMCNEGLSTSAITQLHPKCNKKELTIMIKNTKANLKEGADHILKAAKHMGHAHGLCKGSYACPHDEGSEGHRAYHEGYKSGLDECMGIRNEPVVGMTGNPDMDEGLGGEIVGGIAGHKAGGAIGSTIGGAVAGVPGKVVGQIAGGALGMALGDKVTGESEESTVDTMASYGAMGEAESSSDGNVGADDDGAYDKYDWDAQTVAKKGIDEDEFEEGNAFTGKLAHTKKGDSFKMGNKSYKDTSSLEEDEWTFESFDRELQTHLTEGVKSKASLTEGYTMSITQGEENVPDRVSVNATDAEADKLIKFVKDVGLGQYGDAEIETDAIEPGDVSFYGQPDQLDEPVSSHDDMLKLMGIVDFEDEVEAPGTDVDVQVIDDESCNECGNSLEEGCGCSKTDEGANMAAQYGPDDGSHNSSNDEKGNAAANAALASNDADTPQLVKEKEQGYDDREDEQLGMKDGKESGKKQSMHDRRDDSRGDFGHRHGGHLEEESDAEMDDHAERAGKEVAHDAHYDGRDHSGKDGEDVTKDLEYDDYKDHHMKEESEAEEDDHAEEAGKRDHSNKIKDEDEYDDKKDKSEHSDDWKRLQKEHPAMGDKSDWSKTDEDSHLKEMMSMLSEVGAESSEEPTQPLSQHDDEKLLTKEGAEDAPKDDVNDGENEEITETQTEDQKEFAVAESEEDDLEEGKIPAGLKAYQDKKKGKKVDSKEDKEVDEACGDMKEEKLDEWANDAGKKGTDTSFEQDIDFMTKVISGGVNKQKSTGQTTIPVIAGQNDRTGYNGADSINEGSVMSHDGLAGLMNKMDELSK